MKKLPLITVCLFTITCLLSFSGFSQNFPDLDASPLDAASFPSSYKVSNKLIKVIYSRPQLKGRALSKLAPKYEVWRTGANEATQITFYKDAILGTTKIKAGTYSLFTIPDEKEWTVIINSDTNQWGAYTYDQSKDLARLKVPVKESKKSIEAFSIAFEDSKNGADMHMGWGDVVVTVPFKM